jgi:hypothetical protein
VLHDGVVLQMGLPGNRHQPVLISSSTHANHSASLTAERSTASSETPRSDPSTAARVRTECQQGGD